MMVSEVCSNDFERSCMSHHILTRYKDNGACRVLKGRVLLYIAMLDEPQSLWNREAADDLRQAAKICAEALESGAAEDGVDLRILYDLHDLKASFPVDRNCFGRLFSLQAAADGCRDEFELQALLQEKYGADQIVFVNALNKEGISCARPLDNNSLRGDYFGESLLLFFNSPRSCYSLGYTLLHETLHLFGAADFYLPAQVKEVAEDLLKYSVMLHSGDMKIDELTRYLIGWQPQPSPKARLMLERTKDVTRESINRARTERYKSDK